MKLLRRTLLVLAMGVAACGGGGDDGDNPPVDAPINACVLPAAVTTCTVGDDSPCAALCEGAYCYNFMQLPNPVCTSNCTSAAQCPSGWECNGMGRCRPPG
jgi:hypothetical protein